MDSIFRDAAVVLLLVNEKREIVDINKSGEILSGNNRDDVLGLLAGQSISCINASDNGKVVCGRGKHCGECVIKRGVNDAFLRGKNTYKMEGTMNITPGDGVERVFNVLLSSSLINYNGEKMALITLDDITKQKSIEKQLQEINATKDKFFSIVAHDLKNPFNSILGYSELLMEMSEEESTSEEQQMFVKFLHNSSKHAYSLLEDLLTWARIQMDRLPFNPEMIDLTNVIEENIQLHVPAAAKKSININTKMPNEMNVLADKFMINTVVRNIISNAVKFTKEGGHINLSVNIASNNLAKVEIQDNGVGIPDNVKYKLFSIDENYTSPGTQGEKGTGLGLILCKEFVEKNKGDIGVESEYGKGSTFWFTLPLN